MAVEVSNRASVAAMEVEEGQRHEEKLPYAFYISDQELVVQLGSYLQKHKVSVEKVLMIIYQPQAVFRIRPVSRCSVTIAGKFVAAFRGHVGPVYQISWSADSRLLLSGSKDSTLKVWDIWTQKLKQDLTGHADEVFAVDWSLDGEKVASGGRDRVLKLWMG
ncbi:notchless protein homolog [Actinidia eriantha]|uniref:notchless protein homolog n=1 Tax=Actinidia eriantha TaxID=165200 RepID=UPI002584B4A6|nr:notchless protein homolog [Actinidia eriantha]